MPRKVFIGDIRGKVAETPSVNLLMFEMYCITGTTAPSPRFEGPDLEARRVRRALPRIDATIQFVAEVDTQIRDGARPRPSVQRPPQPAVHRLAIDHGEAEESDDPSSKPELGDFVDLPLLAALLPTFEPTGLPHRDGPAPRTRFPLRCRSSPGESWRLSGQPRLEVSEDLLGDTGRCTGESDCVGSHGFEVLDRSVDVRRSTGKIEERVDHRMYALEDVSVFGVFGHGDRCRASPRRSSSALRDDANDPA